MLARGGKPNLRQRWTEEEDALIRSLYPIDRMALRAALPHRTPGRIQVRASILKCTVKPPWTPQDDARLRLVLATRLSIKKAAVRLKRTEKAIYERMGALGIARGIPEGFESLWASAKRTGFTNLASFRRVLEYGGVVAHLAMTHRPKRRRYHHQFVDPFDVDEAIAKWSRSETLATAARARGLHYRRLQRWLIEAGVVEERRGKNTRTHFRLAPEVVDRVVAERRTAMARVELLGKAAA